MAVVQNGAANAALRVLRYFVIASETIIPAPPNQQQSPDETFSRYHQSGQPLLRRTFRMGLVWTIGHRLFLFRTLSVARTLPPQPHVSVSSVPSGTRNMEVPDADESYSVTDVSIGSISGLDDS